MPSFETDIKPLFRQIDQKHMNDPSQVGGLRPVVGRAG